MSKENDGKTTIVNALNQIILGYDIMGSWIDVQFIQFIYLWDTIYRRKLGSMYQFAAAKKLVFVVRLYDVDVGAGVFWGPSDSFIICVEISAQIADFLGGR